MKLSLPTKEQIKHKTVILRLDLNSPEIDIKHFRFLSTKKMISYLIKNKAKQIIILAHLGRPKKDKHSINANNFDYYNEKLSLKSFKKPLSLLYKTNVSFIKYSVFDEKFAKALKASKSSKIVLLENIRFYKGEEVNEIKLSKKLASLGDIYIDEAFSISHRESSSNQAIRQHIPSFFGVNYIEERQNLENIIEKSKKDLTVIIGGSKISDKLQLIFKFNKKSRFVLVAGAVANTLLHNMGFEVGQSFFEDIFIQNIHKLDFDSVIMPLDVKILNKNNWTKNTLSSNVNPDEKILDIGEFTVKTFLEKISKSKYVFWNGPLGYIEDERFVNSTKELLNFIKHDTKRHYIIGGGETLDCIQKFAPSIFKQKNVFVSTGGGALLEFLSKKL